MTPRRRITAILLISFALFALMRALLLLVQAGDFASLAPGEVLHAFVLGLRFDGAMIAMTVGVALLLWHAPGPWSGRVWWDRSWGWLVYVLLLVQTFLMVTDVLYFGTVHRHVGPEIATIGGDLASMAILGLRQYGWVLALYVVCALLGGYYWRKLLAGSPAPTSRRWPQWAGLALAFLMVVAVGRGGVSGKPVSVVDAFTSDDLTQGHLVLNGAFTISRAAFEPVPAPRVFMPMDVARERVQHHLGHGVMQDGAAGFSLTRQIRHAPKAHHPNVVVLMLEGWSSVHIDAYRKLRGLPPLDLTPRFDQLAREGRLYSRFYANGQRSIEGAAAILAGLPPLPGLPLLGKGLEQNRMEMLGELALAQGYETIFLQSSDRRSLRFDSIARRAGFTRYLANEDIPEQHAQRKPAGVWGTWDHNTFQEAHRRFATMQQPFLGFVFTSTTHTPWLIPDARWEKFPPVGDKEKALNAIHYADWALGELIDAARQSPYYKNTIFVLTADHTNEFVDEPKHVPHLFHVPLLIVGPGVSPGVDDRVGSQVDIGPTVVDLAGWTASFSGLGRSYQDPARADERFALVAQGHVLHWITARGWVSHDLAHRVGASPGLGAGEQASMERDLLALYQLTARLQLENRLYVDTDAVAVAPVR